MHGAIVPHCRAATSLRMQPEYLFWGPGHSVIRGWRKQALSLIDPKMGNFECNRDVTPAPRTQRGFAPPHAQFLSVSSSFSRARIPLDMTAGLAIVCALNWYW